MPEFDAQDAAILEQRTQRFNQHPGPRVGDYLERADGSMLRFTYDHGDRLQTTVNPSLSFYSASFYLSHDGYGDFSGALDSAISKELLKDTGKLRPGSFWFFHHNYATAHNGVEVLVDCRVFQLVEVAHEKAA